MSDIAYNPNCYDCRKAAGKGPAGLGDYELCETHARDTIATLRRELEEVRETIRAANEIIEVRNANGMDLTAKLAAVTLDNAKAVLAQYIELSDKVPAPGGSQFAYGKWYAPKWGCDTLEHVLDALASSPDAMVERVREVLADARDALTYRSDGDSHEVCGKIDALLREIGGKA